MRQPCDFSIFFAARMQFPNRKLLTCNSRKQGEQLSAGCAVALDHAIGLLKAKAGRKRQGPVLGKALPQVAAQDDDTLGVDLSAQA